MQTLNDEQIARQRRLEKTQFQAMNIARAMFTKAAEEAGLMAIDSRTKLLRRDHG